MSDTAHWSLARAAGALRSGEVSSVELTETAVRRIEAIGPALNCVAAMDGDRAMAAARDADERRARSDDAPLLGVPLAHKDMYHRKGEPSDCGSLVLANRPASETASVLEGLDRAGALDIARLNMVEIALGITGHNDHTGPVRNPWNTDYITGGSSSGSGAAVAARLVYGSLGSDTGGSIRFPSAICGITGIKPTYGRVSRFGAMPLAHSLDCPGPLARSAEDCALLLREIAGHDPNDPVTSTRPVPDYAAELARGARGLRVAVPANYFRDPVTPEVLEHVDASLAALEACGAELVEVEVPAHFAEANLINNLITAAEGASFHSRHLRERAGDYGPQVLSRLLTGAMCPASLLHEALSLRAGMLRSFCGAVFDKADLLHTPLMPCPVPTIEETDIAAGPGLAAFLAEMGHCTRPFNYLGLPAASVPCGFTGNGLPVSFQLVGRPFDEATILRLAHAYQQETEWHAMAPATG